MQYRKKTSIMYYNEGRGGISNEKEEDHADNNSSIYNYRNCCYIRR